MAGLPKLQGLQALQVGSDSFELIRIDHDGFFLGNFLLEEGNSIFRNVVAHILLQEVVLSDQFEMDDPCLVFRVDLGDLQLRVGSKHEPSFEHKEGVQLRPSLLNGTVIHVDLQLHASWQLFDLSFLTHHKEVLREKQVACFAEVEGGLFGPAAKRG